MSQKYLNLACGDFYITNNYWVNLDWYPHSKNVTRANLLEKFGFRDGTFDAIYTSHFIEHISRDTIDFVLRECYRVLKPGGIIRIVVPDLENIVREYIRNLENNELAKAEFNTIELLDQCVRTRSGGQLASFRSRGDLSQELREYISERTGYIYKIPTSTLGTRHKTSRLKITKVTRVRVQWVYCKILTKLMPKWFVLNHINFTNTGELHKWVYSEYSLSQHLLRAGFEQVIRVSSSDSQIIGFPYSPLDLDENRNIRKGAESMYIEAFKKSL